MKIKKGFTTNSSSSSYICQVCGCTESGWDIGLSDAEMVECENGHTVCTSHLDNNISKKDILIEYINTDIDETSKKDLEIIKLLDEEQHSDLIDEYYSNYDIECNYPSKYCPICNLEEIEANTMLQYILKTKELDFDNVANEIRNKFTTLDELEKFYKID